MDSSVKPVLKEIGGRELQREMLLAATGVDNAMAQLRAWGQRFIDAGREWRLRQLFVQDRPARIQELEAEIATIGARLEKLDDSDSQAHDWRDVWSGQIATLQTELDVLRADEQTEGLFAISVGACTLIESLVARSSSLMAVSAVPLSCAQDRLVVLPLAGGWWCVDCRVSSGGEATGPWSTRTEAERGPAFAAATGVKLERESLVSFVRRLALDSETDIQAMVLATQAMGPQDQVALLTAWLAARPALIAVPSPAFWVGELGAIDCAPEVLALDRLLLVRSRVAKALIARYDGNAQLQTIGDPCEFDQERFPVVRDCKIERATGKRCEGGCGRAAAMRLDQLPSAQRDGAREAYVAKCWMIADAVASSAQSAELVIARHALALKMLADDELMRQRGECASESEAKGRGTESAAEPISGRTEQSAESP